MPGPLNKSSREAKVIQVQQPPLRAASPASSSSFTSRIIALVSRWTHRDPRLSAAQSNLSLRAKDVAGSLIGINMSILSVSTALTSSGLEAVAEDWRAIAEEYRRLLGETRQQARLASSDVSDFLDTFYPYLRDSSESIAIKSRQINLYSSKLKEKQEKAELITEGLLRVTHNIERFLERFSAAHRRKYPSIDGGARAVKSGIKGLIEAHILIGKDISTILDNAMFPGVMSSTTALLPGNISKDLSTVIPSSFRQAFLLILEVAHRRREWCEPYQYFGRSEAFCRLQNEFARSLSQFLENPRMRSYGSQQGVPGQGLVHERGRGEGLSDPNRRRTESVLYIWSCPSRTPPSSSGPSGGVGGKIESTCSSTSEGCIDGIRSRYCELSAICCLGQLLFFFAFATEYKYFLRSIVVFQKSRAP
ncbi:hypothetical protein SCHPADRAFT_997356 [Schizopora paradoxa]|uniref:Uncharacterized protein n=1 Tax=Schizopora paradoxa TaxID=27342 RepID=A0A0H2RPG8_9AGAM|nr:hypothetical protein SCHPADRAFT_997356 [Schizopora paradoxa]